MERAQAYVEEYLPAAEEPHARGESRAHLSALTTASFHQQRVRLGTIEPPLLALLKHWLKPSVVAIALLLCELFSSQPRALESCALALTSFLIARPVFRPLELPRQPSFRFLGRTLLWALPEWGIVVGLLLLLGFAFRLDAVFPRAVLLSWIGLTPVLQVAAACACGMVLARTRPGQRRHLIVGANEVGEELARRVSQSIGSSTFMGFFDFRSLDRLPARMHDQFSGQCHNVAAFARRHAVDSIYIALPMSNVPRIEALIREFRDTTASIYFVPNIFAFDLVHARCADMNGIPVLSICDTPFHGMNAIKKRVIDLVLSSIALLVCWPLLLAIAIAVRLTSPGPALFRQRRYGLNGEEILIYKFRSMTVCEDGAVVEQARRGDRRITGIGRFLRRTSLDELPQLFNVMGGSMSFVGPRPHAVAHNEHYRKLINGYMIRHKVRPGMSGWAQIHGLRGETTTVEQMRLRVQYDLEYLRDWSLRLDLIILMKSAWIVVRGRNAH